MCSFVQYCFRRANPSLQTFMLLDLNPVMSIIANVPAAIASTVRNNDKIFHLFMFPHTRISNRLSLAGSSGVWVTSLLLVLRYSRAYPQNRVSCRTNFTSRLSTQGSTIAFRSNMSGLRPKHSTGLPNLKTNGVHVHVRSNTISHHSTSIDFCQLF